ncbi:capsular biosynthesis protein [Campylobacter coli]|uniref:galactosyltransferase-related protein n=1 Tax=Campylobacter coli TaxID=195 RepID=UPI000257DD3A|nr:galactosyltransferase-related protein [Campylobacter coli]EAC1803623.1 capsular biosynthesis protein [Campylobacter coli]EAH4463872.1 capsular biosynthesis protein [Campylobacter coli]EAH4489751.1 capsular biosynthesis protein [Campylobacter coli]EAI0583146.1 capsular biosynthesis protein [Campylobacter coli]EAI1617482.1 capsular biosynthesis protein [Campylobacter coli]
MKYKYSVIVPIDLTLRPFDILKKVKSILQRSSEEVEIVFGHNDRRGIFDKYLKKITKKNNVKLISGKFYTRLICQSLLRNRAVEQCSSEFIYLMDVDCLFDEELSDSCINDIKNNKTPFIILSCLYLSRKGSREIFKHTREEMFDKYIAFRKDLYLHLASPSANIFMKKTDYFNIGGFDEEFMGHGGEDFEFMIKLALYKNTIKPTKDLMLNKFYKAPLLSEGFRKYLSFSGLPYFFDKKIVFHLHHNRNKLRGYFKQYRKNSNLLQEKIKFDSSLEENGDSLIKFYEELCKKYNVSIDKYSVLFDSYKSKKFTLEHILLFLKRL